MKRVHLTLVLQALTAALLFGASAPLAKLLLGGVEPILLAGLLYLGSGLGLSIVKIFQSLTRRSADAEAGLKGKDFGWLTGATLAGGIAAPIILLISLERTPAATASLLLNFEVVATTLIAVLAFRESVGKKVVLAISLITLASILLSVDPTSGWGFSLGALGILAACVLWGIDNNFTRNISAKDPLIITLLKGFIGGTFSVGLALLLGNRLPQVGLVLAALALGAFSYGLSIVLFIRAMRGMGAARTSALFSTAPLAGVILSMLIFKALPGWIFLPALVLAAVGTWLLVNEQHQHEHMHLAVTHEHAHTHTDGHHNHQHDEDGLAKHSHEHVHPLQIHDHAHLPDTDHRHAHEQADSSREI
jgi:drug/metabolite transporter (DMT)-like permease